MSRGTGTRGRIREWMDGPYVLQWYTLGIPILRLRGRDAGLRICSAAGARYRRAAVSRAPADSRRPESRRRTVGPRCDPSVTHGEASEAGGCRASFEASFWSETAVEGWGAEDGVDTAAAARRHRCSQWKSNATCTFSWVVVDGRG
eukprot:COSAG02_NODE_2528_length_8603_cov_109.592780_2_plen_146_part_00